MLTLHPKGRSGATARRVSAYPEGMAIEAVATQQATLLGAASPAPAAPSLSEVQLLAGLTPVRGPGVIVTLSDSRKALPPMPAGAMPLNLIHDSDITSVVNELKAAGAEAISVNGQRLVTTSSVRSVGPVVQVNAVPLAAPFVIQAIGDPKTLAAALALPGGVSAIIKDYDPAMFSARQADTLTLPAYSRVGQPRYAKPVAETARAHAERGRERLIQRRDTLQTQMKAHRVLFEAINKQYKEELREAALSPMGTQSRQHRIRVQALSYQYARIYRQAAVDRSLLSALDSEIDRITQ